ncbi:hypothetical protein PFNF135_01707 [Plasmodium falciparum NF135/5.C10]|uniref:Surface antigen n=1 Tax=Plasmodium falciparum NF135/5.C10 TaxID=1036726 RepID=W4ILE0_PLAFA|nr:hypothetical protein PFNF135_01707 [Plasmodium falciparum NF135/5.C10]
MKVHCYNILLFSFTLIILLLSPSQVNNQMNHYNRAHMKNIEPTKSYRSLCECELYTSMYDDDPEMKEIMHDFDRQTSQRFEEYNERMNKNRQKCKEQCEKDIQQIIVKDKVQKSLAVKVEKGCLMCACGLGGGVAPVWSLVSGLWYATWSQYVSTTVVKMATDAGIAEGVKVGLIKITEMAKDIIKLQESEIPAIDVLQKFTTGIPAKDVTLSGIFKTINSNACGQFDSGPHAQFSTWVQGIAQRPNNLRSFTEQAQAVSTAFYNAEKSVLAEGAQATSSLTTAISASIIAIVVIVLVMVIIYLILHYRRKKKTNKKLQYTKLLKE